jgi:hypothetical protein
MSLIFNFSFVLLALVHHIFRFGYLFDWFLVSTKDENVGAGVDRRGGESPYGTL